MSAALRLAPYLARMQRAVDLIFAPRYRPILITAIVLSVFLPFADIYVAALWCVAALIMLGYIYGRGDAVNPLECRNCGELCNGVRPWYDRADAETNLRRREHVRC